LLKHCITHPNVGVQIIRAASENLSEKKQNILTDDIVPQDSNDLIKSLFPQSTISVQQLESNLSFLRNEIQTFYERLKEQDYPSKNKPYPINYSLYDEAGIFLYQLCRIFKPEYIVETGVAYGHSSAYILQALHDNKKGQLFSIDYVFRPWESKEMIGAIIPNELRKRWKLIFGPSSKELKKLLESLGSIDIFFHDSLHTYKNMIFEFKTAWSFITKGGFLLSDDILTNNAFRDFYTLTGVQPNFLLQKGETKSFMGVLQKPLSE